MASLLVHLTHGPEAPTRSALALLVARSAADAGHDVSLFLAGDAAYLLQGEVIDSVVGVGTGSLRESIDALVERGARFAVSGRSSQARGVTEQDLVPTGANFAQPSELVELALSVDRVLTY